METRRCLPPAAEAHALEPPTTRPSQGRSATTTCQGARSWGRLVAAARSSWAVESMSWTARDGLSLLAQSQMRPEVSAEVHCTAGYRRVRRADDRHGGLVRSDERPTRSHGAGTIQLRRAPVTSARRSALAVATAQEGPRVTIQVRRAYDPPSADDGFRVLVDRLWPRGRTRESLHLDQWAPNLGPSHALRRWFGHDPTRWPDFQGRAGVLRGDRPPGGHALGDLAPAPPARADPSASRAAPGGRARPGRATPARGLGAASTPLRAARPADLAPRARRARAPDAACRRACSRRR